MLAKEKRKIAAREMALGVAIVVTGLVMCGVSVMQLAHGQTEIAQTTPPQPGVPAGNASGPAEAKPGGTRPTTPAPEPAQPDSNAQKAGAQPALPPAPAEKVAPPIKTK
ncbi:MAG: hypothetical protein ACTHN2_12080 [Nitrobacter sp.]|jgi:hypothetical protein